jgi:hypothetical protein
MHSGRRSTDVLPAAALLGHDVFRCLLTPFGCGILRQIVNRPTLLVRLGEVGLGLREVAADNAKVGVSE